LTWKTTLVICLLTPFAGAFVYAAVHELRRRLREGPDRDWRGVFEFDADAPSYEPPPGNAGPETGTDQTDAAPRRHDADPDRKGPDMTAEDQIKQTIGSNDVVLFMKGTKGAPQCGFSSRVAGVLNFMGVDYADINVLEDEGIRQGIKDYSDWPTIPQLYVKGDFVGGCDIVTEMTLSGELDKLFDDQGVTYSKEAADKIRAANA